MCQLSSVALFKTERLDLVKLFLVDLSNLLALELNRICDALVLPVVPVDLLLLALAVVVHLLRHAVLMSLQHLAALRHLFALLFLSDSLVLDDLQEGLALAFGLFLEALVLLSELSLAAFLKDLLVLDFALSLSLLPSLHASFLSFVSLFAAQRINFRLSITSFFLFGSLSGDFTLTLSVKLFELDLSLDLPRNFTLLPLVNLLFVALFLGNLLLLLLDHDFV